MASLKYWVTKGRIEQILVMGSLDSELDNYFPREEYLRRDFWLRGMPKEMLAEEIDPDGTDGVIFRDLGEYSALIYPHGTVEVIGPSMPHIRGFIEDLEKRIGYDFGELPNSN